MHVLTVLVGAYLPGRYSTLTLFDYSFLSVVSVYPIPVLVRENMYMYPYQIATVVSTHVLQYVEGAYICSKQLENKGASYRQ